MARGLQKGRGWQPGLPLPLCSQVWYQNRKVKSIDLTALDKHGSVYDDSEGWGDPGGVLGTGQLVPDLSPQTSSAAWPGRTQRLTCCMWRRRSVPRPNPSSRPKRPSWIALLMRSWSAPRSQMHPSRWAPTTSRVMSFHPGAGTDGTVPQGEQFVYHEDWGETLSTRSVPVLCVLDIEGSSISVLEGVPKHVSPGQVRMGKGDTGGGGQWETPLLSHTVHCSQAFWSPDDTGVVFVGRWHEPFRLGLRHCNNRR